MFEDLEEGSSRKMSGVSRVKSMNVVDSEARAILVPAGNKAQRSPGSRKPVSKPIKKAEKSTEEVGLMEDNNDHQLLSLSLQSIKVASLPQRQNLLSHSSLSLSSSYSTDSFHSKASTGRIHRTRSSTSSRKKQFTSKSKSVVSDNASDSSLEGLQTKRRCAWVTTSTDQSYAIFHDEEWEVPVHDDKRLFELLVLCGALAELTLPSILNRRHIFRYLYSYFTVKMGRGKGNPTGWIARVSRRQILFEMDGVSLSDARQVTNNLVLRLPILLFSRGKFKI